MRLKTCLLIEAALVGAGLVWFLSIGGCGVGDLAEDLSPTTTIVNVLPGGDGDECEDCPRGIRIVDLFAVEIDTATWGIGAAFDGGCVDSLWLDTVEAGMWSVNVITDQWMRTHEWDLSVIAPVCIGNVMAWYPIPQPCAGETWCGIEDVWIELHVTDMPGFHAQAFTRPGTGLPGF